MSRNTEKGFTLVELSIVLVIIGLLIGGILVAQSMVGTAKIQAAVTLFQQTDIAVSNFKNKYNGFPGDSPLLIPAGNNDGKISSAIVPSNSLHWRVGVSGTGYQGNYETSTFWMHLFQSGYTQKKNSFTNVLPADGSYDIKSLSPNAPQIPVGTNTALIAAGYWNCPNEHCYIAAAALPSLSPGAVNLDRSMNVADVYSLDQKLDDGTAAGNLQFSCSGSYNDLSYDFSVTTPCLFYLNMLAQSGE